LYAHASGFFLGRGVNGAPTTRPMLDLIVTNFIVLSEFRAAR
jgi:hypothetical protein